jgi:hypothetical protein
VGRTVIRRMPFNRYLHERMDQGPPALILSLRVLIYATH